ncbi:hypothetical protein OG936_26680 [Streptomyces sp. NBC_00846]|nr:hypothetical protein OG936_26680 [Streptomyces sp. NBC_00846]
MDPVEESAALDAEVGFRVLQGRGDAGGGFGRGGDLWRRDAPIVEYYAVGAGAADADYVARNRG